LIFTKVKNVFRQIIFKLPLEATIWITGLIALAIYYPADTSHASLCVFNNLGFTFCPGCGLGRSISYLMHGEFINSLVTHPFGILAVVILLSRSLKLFFDYYKGIKLKKY